MFYAKTAAESRALATPGAMAWCPVCGFPVRAKCGPIVAWHWAHVGRDDCDPWAERDTFWHRRWQSTVPEPRREVIFDGHRADIVTANGAVVELQHSTISVDDIHARENFYGNMVWIFDVTKAYDEQRFDVRQRKDYFSFRWKHPRKTVGACRRTVFLDLGDGRLLHLRRIHLRRPCGGWGQVVRKADLIWWFNGGPWPQHISTSPEAQGKPEPDALAQAIARLSPEQRVALGIE